jgi:outer membrane biosynthesis protein TonB
MNFESNKNTRAAAYTAVVAISLLLIFFLVAWDVPKIPEPTVDEGISVNLGDSDDGSGDDQPMKPGEPAPVAENIPQPQAQEPDPVKEEVKTEDDVKNDEEPAVVKKEEKPVLKPITKPVVTPTPSTTKPVVKPTVTPTPAPPKPKATLGKTTGGNGDGGNGAAIYKPGNNQGNGTGNGDKGKPGGDPNSTNYEGAGGNGNGRGGNGTGGINIKSGLSGRSIVSKPSFSDEFNKSGKIEVRITVDESGKVTNAVVSNDKIGDREMRNIAIRKALQLKFDAGEESTGVIEFNFKLNN